MVVEDSGSACGSGRLGSAECCREHRKVNPLLTELINKRYRHNFNLCHDSDNRSSFRQKERLGRQFALVFVNAFLFNLISPSVTRCLTELASSSYPDTTLKKTAASVRSHHTSGDHHGSHRLFIEVPRMAMCQESPLLKESHGIVTTNLEERQDPQRPRMLVRGSSSRSAARHDGSVTVAVIYDLDQPGDTQPAGRISGEPSSPRQS